MIRQLTTITLLLAIGLPVVEAAKPSGTKQAPIYHTGWIDLNKNGRMDIYEDPSAPVDARIADLLSQMSVEEKTCQLATLYGYKRVLADALPHEG